MYPILLIGKAKGTAKGIAKNTAKGTARGTVKGTAEDTTKGTAHASLAPRSQFKDMYVNSK